MNELRRDNLEIENSGTAFGVTHGNVTNDNRAMSGNNIIGPRGGVYYVDEFGKREYIDREKGRELYRKRQEDKSDAQQ